VIPRLRVSKITRQRDPEKAAEIETWIDQVAQTWNILSSRCPRLPGLRKTHAPASRLTRCAKKPIRR